MVDIERLIHSIGLLIILGAFFTALWSMRNLFRGQAEIHAAYQKLYKARNIKSEPPAITMIGRIEALKLFGADWEKLEPVRLHVHAQRTIIRCMMTLFSTLILLIVLGLFDVAR